MELKLVAFDHQVLHVESSGFYRADISKGWPVSAVVRSQMQSWVIYKGAGGPRLTPPAPF